MVVTDSELFFWYLCTPIKHLMAWPEGAPDGLAGRGTDRSVGRSIDPNLATKSRVLAIFSLGSRYFFIDFMWFLQKKNEIFVCPFNLKSVSKDSEFYCESIHRCGFSFWEKHFFGRNRLGIIFFGTFVPPLRSPDHPRHFPEKNVFLFFSNFFQTFFNNIFFYLILFYFITIYFILFYSSIFYFIVIYFVLFYFILFYLFLSSIFYLLSSSMGVLTIVYYFL